jgi:hypothetical protein
MALIYTIQDVHPVGEEQTPCFVPLHCAKNGVSPVNPPFLGHMLPHKKIKKNLLFIKKKVLLEK